MRFLALAVVVVLVPIMFAPVTAQESTGPSPSAQIQASSVQAVQQGQVQEDVVASRLDAAQRVEAQPAPPPAAQPAPSSATGTTVWFYSGNPFTTGDLIAMGAPTDTSIAELGAATYADVRVCSEGHVFAVTAAPQAGASVSTTMLVVRGGTLSLADVTTQLEQACAAGRIQSAAEALGANHVFTTPAAGPPGAAPTGANVFFIVANDAGRHVAALTRITDLASSELSTLNGVAFVRLQSGIYGYVFAVAQLPQTGQPIGDTLIQLNGGTMALAKVADQIEAARRGDAELVLFAQGATSDDVIVAMVSPADVNLSDAVPFTGATTARVWTKGQVQVYAITSTGSTMATIMVCPSRETGCTAQSGLFTAVVPKTQSTQ